MTIGEALTRWTVRAAVLLYVASVWRQLGRRDAAAIPATGRWAWTAGCVFHWVHVALAMHVFHGWDHAAMVRETARQTAAVAGWDWGGGAYVNYAFMLVWAADAAWWWAAGDQRYRRRPVAMTVAVHAFLASIAFNAVVVFAHGPVRWAGVAACAVIAARWAWVRGIHERRRLA